MTRAITAHIGRHLIAYLALFVALGGTSYAAAKLPRNSVGTKQLRKNAVISTKVKDRSLLERDFKRGQLPAGPMGAPGAAGPQGPPGPQGPKGDPAYKKTLLVDAVGTMYDNGAALRSALASITDAGAGNRYLLKIEPGMYFMGSTPLAMKPYVDIEGSGAEATTINGSVTGSDGALVIAAHDTQLRYLEVVDNGAGGNVAVAVVSFVPSFTLDHVSAEASNAATYNIGLNLYGGSDPSIRSSRLVGTGGQNAYGIFADSSAGAVSPTIEFSVIEAFLGSTESVGYKNLGGPITSTTSINWSRVASLAPGKSIDAGPKVNVRVGASELAGAVAVDFYADVKCISSWKAVTFAGLSTACA